MAEIATTVDILMSIGLRVWLFGIKTCVLRPEAWFPSGNESRRMGFIVLHLNKAHPTKIKAKAKAWWRRRARAFFYLSLFFIVAPPISFNCDAGGDELALRAPDRLVDSKECRHPSVRCCDGKIYRFLHCLAGQAVPVK